MAGPRYRAFDAPTVSFLALAAGFTAVAAAGGLSAEESPFHLSSYTMTLLGKYLALAILALALDLVWGYMGVLSLGHAAFFALGGYALGMYLTRCIGAQGVYGNALLPDFMVFLDWKDLPWFWRGSGHFIWSLTLVFAAPALLAFVFGWLAFGSRVSGVYFSIMSQALTYALMLAFFRNEMGFGGNNGLTDFKTLLGFDLHTQAMRTALFVASALALMGAYIACRLIVVSRLGRIATAIRDAESRTRFIGYRVERVQLAVFTLSAAIAGLGGALFVPQAGIINPGEFAPVKSVEVVICVALGGRGKLYGAVLGAVAVNSAKTWFTAAWPDGWLFALGGLFILTPLVLPDGLAGLFERVLAPRGRGGRRAGGAAAAGASGGAEP
ncbi:MAG: urea ABC transporter permease subunit UrtC [Planctomycetota bacterium]|jgi:urea transport system permease protein|nr:urea ABC transporter permease subunit UrtC [Planctomycetota bacterium]